MMGNRLAVLILLGASVGFAQLTLDQKVSDFEHLAGLYAKNYAPYEWKRDTQKFDLLDTSRWLDKIRATKDDLDFYEVMVEYVASLNDAHDTYLLPSSFAARLNFTVDIFDGKVLVDSINRTRLPAAEFPFQIGYEVVSVDGRSAEQLIADFAKYAALASPSSSRRYAASLIPFRPQALMPHAVDTGDIAVVVMARLDGGLETYHIPWTKSGLPLRIVGPVPMPASMAPLRADSPGEPAPQDYMEPLRRLQNCSLPDRGVLSWGSRGPIFQLPPSFVQRLGLSSADFFYSGTFQAGGFKIGFIRIPSYSPADPNSAILQFYGEILYMRANTDGLIIDDMRNPGGQVSFVNALLQFLIPYRFRTLGFEVRATSEWVAAFSSSYEAAKAQRADQWVIDLLGSLLAQIQQANSELRGRTGPLPLDDVTIDRDPETDVKGNVLAYNKPLMVLVDEFSASSGDLFPATIQDNQRGPIFGMRTMGAGGSVGSWPLQDYSEGSTSITMSLMNRKAPVAVDGYPAAPYVENIGVRPDIVVDYMTKDNLLLRGKPYVDAFVAAMVDHISKNR